MGDPPGVRLEVVDHRDPVSVQSQRLRHGGGIDRPGEVDRLGAAVADRAGHPQRRGLGLRRVRGQELAQHLLEARVVPAPVDLQLQRVLAAACQQRKARVGGANVAGEDHPSVVLRLAAGMRAPR